MGQRLAYLIANQSFAPESGLDDLQGPYNDIEAVQAALEASMPGEYSFSVIRDGTREDIALALDRGLGRARFEDFVLIYYSGHGQLDRSGGLCLATRGTLRDALNATSVTARELKDMIGNSDCGSVVVMLDCCFSGAVGGKGLKGNSVESKLMEINEAAGVHILAASGAYQTARETAAGEDGKPLGRFTREIVDGIVSGSAARPDRREITLSGLRDYVGLKIRGQTPLYFTYNALSDPVIARAPSVSVPDEDSAEMAIRRQMAVIAEVYGAADGLDYNRLKDLALPLKLNAVRLRETKIVREFLSMRGDFAVKSAAVFCAGVIVEARLADQYFDSLLGIATDGRLVRGSAMWRVLRAIRRLGSVVSPTSVQRDAMIAALKNCARCYDSEPGKRFVTLDILRQIDSILGVKRFNLRGREAEIFTSEQESERKVWKKEKGQRTAEEREKDEPYNPTATEKLPSAAPISALPARFSESSAVSSTNEIMSNLTRITNETLSGFFSGTRKGDKGPSST